MDYSEKTVYTDFIDIGFCYSYHRFQLQHRYLQNPPIGQSHT